MDIVFEKPPVWDKAVAAFDLSGRRPLFAWGDKIYNPLGGVIDDHMLVHEAVHARQQGLHPGGIEGWWEQYLADAEFRFKQEVEAYRAQVLSARRGIKDRHQLFLYTRRLALDLAGPMYGNVCSLSEAMRIIAPAV